LVLDESLAMILVVSFVIHSFILCFFGEAPDPKFAATIPLALFATIQLKFAITPALNTGSFAKRIRLSSLCLSHYAHLFILT